MNPFHELFDYLQLFPETLLCGTVMAVVCSVFGVFVILKRIVFVSIALSETATCGLALGMLLGVSPLCVSCLLTAVAVMVMTLPELRDRLPRDVVLGTVFLLGSSFSILLVSKSGFGLEEVKAMLYGDLLVSSPADRWTLLLTGLPSLVLLLAFLRPILLVSVDREAAKVMGMRCWLWEALFFTLLGIVVSGASKNGGALLVFALLVVVPATALLLARRLWVVLLLAAGLGALNTWLGCLGSYHLDLPVNPTIIALCCLLFAAVALGFKIAGWIHSVHWHTSTCETCAQGGKSL